jgi:hypothetical protein
MDDEANWEEVFRTVAQVEMELIRGLLETSGFPVVVKATGLKSMPVIFGAAAYGEWILKVPPELAEQARELLAAQVEMPDEQPEP